MELARRLREGDSVEALARELEALAPPERLARVRLLKARDQALLWERASGRACTVERDFLAGAGAHETVVHEGRNSLLLFRDFQKRFCRPSPAHAPALAWGYNEQAWRPVTGPGYFVAHEETAENAVRTVVIDYRRLPDEQPPGWPPIRPNSARLSRFIYEGTGDWMWRVCDGVTVGRARRDTGWMDNWFVLVRMPR